MDIEQVKDIKLNFILAIARSGSTLLSSMLNVHPNVISTFEEPFAYNLYPKYKKIKIWTSETIQTFCYDFYLFSEGKLAFQFGTKKDLETILEVHKQNLTSEIAIKLAYLCFFPNKDKSNITTIVDKQLIFYYYLEKVAAYYPQSKFIILHRDPRDQAVARYAMLKKENQAQSYYRIASQWNFVYTKLTQLKTKIGSNRFIELKYEDLVANPEVELRKICFFMNILFEEDMLHYDEKINKEVAKTNLNAATLNEITLFHGGLRQKPNTHKIGYWRTQLKPQEANLIWTICGELAQSIGYKTQPEFKTEPLAFKNYISQLTILRIKITQALYYAAPFWIKYLVKKIKYGKNFKGRVSTGKDFYQKTYYSK